MKTYRFVTTTHHDVFAETVEEAVQAFDRMRREGISPKCDTVVRIEVLGKEGKYVPVDRPMRAEYLEEPGIEGQLPC